MIQTNHYCVPTALSILISMPVDAVEKILKDVYLGDIEISGIYIGLALKFLSDNGYHWLTYNTEGDRLEKYKNYAWTYEKDIPGHLMEIKGHALVLKQGKVYDNSHVDGIDLGIYERRAERIVRAYRITKL